jgi:thiol-disulfide isomerase/thioredoxin
MIRRIALLIMAFAVVGAVLHSQLVAQNAASPAVASSPVGRLVELSSLSLCLGADAVASWKQSRATVIIFVGTECPLVARYAPRLAELAQKYRGQGIRFFGVDSNQQDSLAAITHFSQVHRLPFIVCKDAGNGVADQLGAMRTPEAFILNDRARYLDSERLKKGKGIPYLGIVVLETSVPSQGGKSHGRHCVSGAL